MLPLKVAHVPFSSKETGVNSLPTPSDAKTVILSFEDHIILKSGSMAVLTSASPSVWQTKCFWIRSPDTWPLSSSLQDTAERDEKNSTAAKIVNLFITLIPSAIIVFLTIKRLSRWTLRHENSLKSQLDILDLRSSVFADI